MKSRSFGFSGRNCLMTSKFDTSIPGISSGGSRKKSPLGPPLPRHTERRRTPPTPHHHTQPKSLQDGDLPLQTPAERKADQMEFIEAERVEQVEIVHDVVMN